MLLLTKGKVKIIYQTSRIRTSLINVDTGAMMNKRKILYNNQGHVGNMTSIFSLIFQTHLNYVKQQQSMIKPFNRSHLGNYYGEGWEGYEV